MNTEKYVQLSPYPPMQGDVDKKAVTTGFTITRANNSIEELSVTKLQDVLYWAARGYEKEIEINIILEEVLKNVFDNINPEQLADALILAASAFIERDPAYSSVAARLLQKKLFKEVTSKSLSCIDLAKEYRDAFLHGIQKGVTEQIFDSRMLNFDLKKIAESLQPERDELFEYMGLRTLYERYFAKTEDQQRFELPQHFWMRVAMGISYNEENKTECAIEFYNLMSTMRYVPSTPTLLHSGLMRPQLSSCFLGTVEDDLKHIFKCLGDNAQLSKWSGGVAYDWTNVRATGAMVKSIKTESQGVIPYLKIANDVTAAINRSGKRRSAAVVYLETWHLDVEDFLDLRRNTGDERRRTHDVNTANWVPDLFIKRVIADGKWTLFSPEEAPDLHHIYGKAFEKRYEEYENMAAQGKIKKYKEIEASALWKKMLSRLFETGHPWITFKDPSNIRSPQDHAGVIHNSNLCTEITLNTSAEETAVCNLGSINLSKHVQNGVIDYAMLKETVTTAVRALDNVIDINFYPTVEAEHANLKHRPIGMGLMGFQDLLYSMNLPFDDASVLDLADELMETISYHAIAASSALAKERGAYASYHGSKWDRNIFPHDTIDLLEQERGMPIEVKRGGKLDWQSLRDHVKQYGMRNSNTMAIAPTATISNIAGCIPCIEPIYKNLYVKANMSGEFTVVNHYLVEDLKKLNLWNQDMLEQLKYFDGNVSMITSIPQILKDKYKEAFEIDPEWLVRITAARGKWIDQSQSHNVFLRGVSGKKLNAIYISGWKAGLKTFYYLRTLGATQIEKSTLDAKKYGFTQKREYTEIAEKVAEPAEAPKTVACSISSDPSCEVCQ
ncbi:MAG: ribonucleoside-diphosphate reductase subunit alpha [Candidatus Dependentiae bacterium]|nr:ribonucleoside-diphosphate reductase subunit alpha [Candidatus Dependentiae bacterium]